MAKPYQNSFRVDSPTYILRQTELQMTEGAGKGNDQPRPTIRSALKEFPGYKASLVRKPRLSVLIKDLISVH